MLTMGLIFHKACALSSAYFCPPSNLCGRYMCVLWHPWFYLTTKQQARGFYRLLVRPKAAVKVARSQ